MFIDASALTALLTDEDEARELLARLQQTGTRLTSPLAVWEAAVAVARVLDVSVSAAAEAVEELSRADGDRRGRGAAGNGTARARRLRPVRQGPASGEPQFRGLFCLCLRPASGAALDVQGRRLSADRYRGRLTPATPAGAQVRPAQREENVSSGRGKGADTGMRSLVDLGPGGRDFRASGARIADLRFNVQRYR